MTNDSNGAKKPAAGQQRPFGPKAPERPSQTEMKVDAVIYDRVKFSQSGRGRVLGVPPRDAKDGRSPD